MDAWQLVFATFYLGMFAITAQVLFTREMLVVFLGNELCIGTIMASWLAGIAAGSVCARHLGKTVARIDSLRAILQGTAASMALLLPVQVYAMRNVRLWWRIAPGEYAPLGAVLVGTLLTFLPSCLGIGLFFPLTCEMASRQGQKSDESVATPVSRLYAADCFGSLLGGFLLSFVALGRITPGQTVCLGCAGALAAGAFAARRGRTCLAVLILAVAVAASGFVGKQLTARLDSKLLTARWRGLGVVNGAGEAGNGARVLWSLDTVYQNLAVVECGGQYTLYGNGQVQFVFPDPVGYEHSVHFLMAQNPNARRILVLGGNPLGELPELLKYPLTRLVFVELDPGVNELIKRTLPEEFAAVTRDPRIAWVIEDGPRYVQHCRERFDVVLVNGPEPTTAAANRYYTLEFFRNVLRILTEDGFVYTAVTSSERLQTEAANLGASVYQTLKAVFPRVLVTAEARNRFFASTSETGRTDVGVGLTLDPVILAERSRNAGIKTSFFRPEYFLGADELAPDKVTQTTRRFETARVPLNSHVKPATYFFNLLLWAKASGSSLAGVLSRLTALNVRCMYLTLLVSGAGFVLVGVVLRRRVRPAGWSRCMLAWVIATTGFAGMAIEVLLILVFQSLYGYVYTRIGLLVAMFMLGLTAGAPFGAALVRSGQRYGWLVLATGEIALAGCAATVPVVVRLAGQSASGADWVQGAIMALIVLVGLAVGAEFPAAVRMFVGHGSSPGSATALMYTADLIGAAIGSLAMGVLLVPVLGIGAASGLLAMLKGVGLAALFSATLARLSRPSDS